MLVFSQFQEGQNREFTKSFLESNFSDSEKKPNSFFKRFKNGFTFLVKVPVKVSSGTVGVLEKIGDGFRKTPDVIFSKAYKVEKKTRIKKTAKNPAQGIYFGAESVVTEVVGALAGLVAEPIKGAKKKGMLGATAGIGKGIAGLIFKPVAGTIDLVTHTARGVGTVPGVIYKDVFRIKKKSSDSSPKEKQNLALIYEDEKEQVFVDKKRLSVQGLIAAQNPVLIGAHLNYKEKYEEEKLKREQLTKVMMDVLNNLDDDTKNKNMDLVSSILQSPISPSHHIEEEEKKELDNEKEITQIMEFCENENVINEETEEKLYEFFFIRNTSSQTVSKISMKTVSFDDKPIEKFHKSLLDNDNDNISVVQKEEESEFRYILNNAIPIEDSDEFDADEFKQNEMRVAIWLSLHTGRDGRNGPAFQTILEDESPNIIYGDILEFEESVYQDEICDLKVKEKIGNVVPEFEHQSSILDVVNCESMIEQEWSNLNQLIPKHFEKKPLKNWEYPNGTIDLPFKELEDLPDVMKLRDYEVKGKEVCGLGGSELIEFLENWKPIENKDDVRFPFAYKKGGRTPENEIIMKKLRVIAKEFLMKVGRSVLSGNFNLTTVPFPIKASIPRSYFENIGVVPTSFYPLYLNLAMKTQDPLQRFKFYIVATISYFYLGSPFAKPFNPILGETFNGYHSDGSQAYLEQVSHHPQVSYLLYYGPKQAYRVWGPSNFAAHAGLNSLKLTTKSWRKIEFADTKQVITNNFPNEHYEGILWGTTISETAGSMDFVDHENKLTCKIVFGSVKKKPSDYIEGDILVDGKIKSHVYGTCLGFIEIDQQRYFDYRFCHPFPMYDENSPLHSDFKYRPDYLHLKQGYVEKAQKEKETLEELQRHDAKLRKAAALPTTAPKKKASKV